MLKSISVALLTAIFALNISACSNKKEEQAEKTHESKSRFSDPKNVDRFK